MFSLDSLRELTVGASVQNVFNTFAWDTSKIVSRKVAGAIDNGTVKLDDSADVTGSKGDLPQRRDCGLRRKRMSSDDVRRWKG